MIMLMIIMMMIKMAMIMLMIMMMMMITVINKGARGKSPMPRRAWGTAAPKAAAAAAA